MSDGLPVAASRRRWLWVFDEPAGFKWVVANQEMVFSSAKRRAFEIRAGDLALMYVTAGGLRGSGRYESIIAGLVRVVSDVRSRPSLRIPGVVGRTFVLGCAIEFELLPPFGEGPAVKPIVRELSMVKRPDIWGQYFRGSPIELCERDFQILAARLTGTTEL